ncbi:26S proteasome complex subunit SEM1 [Linderina macrospora]|uniref:26S proteasome complex subunit SEM1 n=1 Tax=Linderina macrospora TaxID=4868 RepID=A0ACC1J3U3_9FUNG|nr:26S proteasome complex subunit SEM1 [Linderina macrospora]
MLPNFRAIFASFRTAEEERSYRNTAILKFACFVAMCAAMSVTSNSTAAEQQAPTNTTQRLPTTGALEEDDEFEEFEVEDWTPDAEDKEDATLWDDNWDDDDLEDDFSNQLRVELAKGSQPEAMAVSN